MSIDNDKFQFVEQIKLLYAETMVQFEPWFFFLPDKDIIMQKLHID